MPQCEGMENGVKQWVSRTFSAGCVAGSSSSSMKKPAAVPRKKWCCARGPKLQHPGHLEGDRRAPLYCAALGQKEAERRQLSPQLECYASVHLDEVWVFVSQRKRRKR